MQIIQVVAWLALFLMTPALPILVMREIRRKQALRRDGQAWRTREEVTRALLLERQEALAGIEDDGERVRIIRLYTERIRWMNNLIVKAEGIEAEKLSNGRV